jgi:NAD(P)H-dependent FMN reductase
MKKLLTLCGSVRADSLNRRILTTAIGLLAPDATGQAFERLAALPAFDPAWDLGPPDVVAEFRALVRSADAVLISSPEYAHGIPGSLKNALDWLVGSGELVGKPVGILLVSASNGAFARQALVEVLHAMSARVPDAAVAAPLNLKSLWNGNPPAPEPLIQTLHRVLTAMDMPVA